MKIVVVGDFITKEQLGQAASELNYPEEKQIVALHWGWDDDIEAFQDRIHAMERNGPEGETPPAGLLEEIVDADMLLVHLCPVPRRVIEAATRLKLIGTCRAGLEHINLEAANARGIPVMHVVRNADSVADLALGLMLCELRNIARCHAAVRGGTWDKIAIGTTLRGQTVGLVGFGHIGRKVAERLKPFGARVLAYDPIVPREEMLSQGVSPKELPEIFEEADIVSLHARLAEDSQGLIGRDLLARLRPGAYFINTARAGLVDEAALIELLEARRISGAALDVFREEPLPADHPFLRLDNVTLTPHIGGTTDELVKSHLLLRDAINAYIASGRSDLIVN